MLSAKPTLQMESDSKIAQKDAENLRTGNAKLEGEGCAFQSAMALNTLQLQTALHSKDDTIAKIKSANAILTKQSQVGHHHSIGDCFLTRNIG